MKLERDWELLSQIFVQRQVCIIPGSVNFRSAKYDFDEGSCEYYLFPLDEEGIGYMRLLKCEDPKGLFVDYISPWRDQLVPINLNELAKKRNIYIPVTNVPDSLYSPCENLGLMYLYKMFRTVRQKVYCEGIKDVLRINCSN